MKEQESQTATDMEQSEQNPESTKDTVEPLQETTGSTMETTNQSQPETDNQRVRDKSITNALPETRLWAQFNPKESTADQKQQLRRTTFFSFIWLGPTFVTEQTA